MIKKEEIIMNTPPTHTHTLHHLESLGIKVGPDQLVT